jgi:trypsin-like peptidase
MTKNALYFAGALILLQMSGSYAVGQVTRNVLTRVLMLKTSVDSGSSFTMEVRQYLITAKHLVRGLPPEDTVEYMSEKWTPITVQIFKCDDPVDIAVLVPPKQLTETLPLEGTTDKVLFGQDAFFLGFPFGISNAGRDLNGQRPFALVKKGVFSAMNTENGATVIMLDGHNNPGFSGGPIVYRDQNQSDFVFYVAGVVSGFRPEFVYATKPEEIKEGEDISKVESWRIVTKNGRKYQLKDTELVVPLNTGIVSGFHIQTALDLIKKHPVGPTVKSRP